MKILVCITHVPDTTSKIQFTANNTKFDTTGVQFIVYNPSESNTYPLKSEVFKARIDTFLLMGTFRIKSQSEVLVVLEKL